MILYKSDNCQCTIPLKMSTVRILKKLYKTKKTSVYLITAKGHDTKYALKRYNKDDIDDEDVQDVMFEINIQKDLEHEHIIHLYAAWETKHGYYFLLEYAEHGDVFDLIYKSKKVYSHLHLVKNIVYPVALAVEYLHERDIIHSDIKPENIGIVSGRRAALMDFGLALRFDEYIKTCDGVACTEDYAAPEIVYEKKIRDPKPVDVWCIGLLLYELLTKESPKCMVKLHPKKIKLPDADLKTKQFLKACVAKNAADRPTIKRLCEMLRSLIDHLELVEKAD